MHITTKYAIWKVRFSLFKKETNLETHGVNGCHYPTVTIFVCISRPTSAVFPLFSFLLFKQEKGKNLETQGVNSCQCLTVTNSQQVLP